MDDSEKPVYVEPIIIPDMFVTGLASVELVSGEIYRFTFYAEQTSAVDGRVERVIVNRAVVTESAMVAMFTEAAKQVSDLMRANGKDCGGHH